MTSFLRFLLTAGLAFSVSFSAAGTVYADGSEIWRAESVTGQVTVSVGAQGADRGVGVGDRLQAPFTIHTGPKGQLTLSRGGDRVSVGPASRTQVLPDTHQAGGVATRVEQSQGSVLYRVRKRQKDSFEVQTPFLVSVVKGTTFNVNTDAAGSTVALMEGSVLVQSLDGADSLLLQPGQAAARSALDPQLRLHDPQSMGSPTNGKVTLIRNGSESAGETVVLREAPAAAVSTALERNARHFTDDSAGLAVTDDAYSTAVAPTLDINAVGAGDVLGGADAVAGIGTDVDLGGADSVAGIGTDVDLGGATAAAGDSVSSAVETATGAVGSELPDLSAEVGSPTVAIEDVLRKVTAGGDDDLDDLEGKLKDDD